MSSRVIFAHGAGALSSSDWMIRLKEKLKEALGIVQGRKWFDIDVPIGPFGTKSYGQPRVEDDIEEGLLSVSLLKHQKIALGWMVQKEKSIHCASGILVDDRGKSKWICISIDSNDTEEESQLSKILEDEVDEEEAEVIFSSSWLPEKKSKVTKEKPKASKKCHHEEYEVEGDEDLVENLVLSSDGGEIQDKV